MGTEKRIPVTVVQSTRASALPPEQLRKAAFEKYKYRSPWNVMPSLKDRMGTIEGTIFNGEVTVDIHRNDGATLEFIHRRVGNILNNVLNRIGGNFDFAVNRVTYAIISAGTAIKEREEVKSAQIKWVKVSRITPIAEKDKPITLFEIALQIVSTEKIDENSTREASWFYTTARLVVSTAKETDIDAQRITNFSNRIGMITFVSLHEQNPAEKPRGHYGERMRAQVEKLTQELEATKKELEARKEAIRELQGQVNELEEKVDSRDGTITKLRNVADSLRTLITNALRTLREAGLGNRTKSIETAVTELERGKTL